MGYDINTLCELMLRAIVADNAAEFDIRAQSLLEIIRAQTDMQSLVFEQKALFLTVAFMKYLNERLEMLENEELIVESIG